MKTSMVQMDMPKIEINGKAFELKQSDGDVYHNAREALAQCARLNTRDPDAVLTVLKELCGVIDDALGAGAVKQIVGDKPVSLPMALKILNTIIETCNARYKKYIQDEYLKGNAMKSFSLSSLDALPESVREGGEEYAVNTDFRVILRIFRMLGDPEISEKDKPWLLRRMFFAEKIPANADRHFEWFAGCGREKGESSGNRDFDYEQDAAEIYSAFRQVYGIDLIDIENLHWWRFLPLLEGLFCCENALSNKVHLRHTDDSESQRKASLDRQKRAVSLRESISRTEAAIEEQLRERLKNGLPIGDLMGR